MANYSGTPGIDIITGTSGDDYVDNVGVGADVVATLGGNDTVRAIPEVNALLSIIPSTIDMGTGYDHLILDYTTSINPFSMSAPVLGLNVGFGGQVALLGTEALAYVGVDAFTILGSAAGDTLYGGGNSDYLVGGGGADVLTGGGGADTFAYAALSDSTPKGYDRITDFQTGSDKLDVSRVDGGVVVLAFDGAGSTGVYYAPTAQGTPGGAILAQGTVQGADLVLSANAFVNIQGSGAGETLIGSSHGDLIQGNGGADVLVGGGGADTFKYAAVSDSAVGSSVDYIADFQHGSDKIDLTGITGSLVGLSYAGSGNTYVLFDLGPSGWQGGIVVHGDVTQSDLVVSAGTGFYVAGSFSTVDPGLVETQVHHALSAGLGVHEYLA